LREIIEKKNISHFYTKSLTN
jgi:hypothetical protein